MICLKNPKAAKNAWTSYYMASKSVFPQCKLPWLVPKHLNPALPLSPLLRAYEDLPDNCCAGGNSSFFSSRCNPANRTKSEKCDLMSYEKAIYADYSESRAALLPDGASWRIPCEWESVAIRSIKFGD